jgi:hypothetical protein
MRCSSTGARAMSHPWVDRKMLLKNARSFVNSHGYFLRVNAKRISSLVEIAVYNSIVRYYESRGYEVEGENLGPKKSFRYKLTSAGLTENYSYFVARKDGFTFHIFHNVSLQSAHDNHLYFTADIVVTNERGATTKRLKSGRRHSYVAKADLVTFAEVKHLTPFPEVLFNFMGLVLEFMPGFVQNTHVLAPASDHPCPMITFTGAPSDHAERIQQSLSSRYGINIVFSTSRAHGQLAGCASLNRYNVTCATRSTVNE